MSRLSTKLMLLFGAFVALLLSHPIPTQAQRQGNREMERVNGRDVVAGEVLVKLREATRPDQVNQIRGLADADSMQPVGRRGVRRLQSRSLSATALLGRLAGHPDLLYAEPNYIIRTLADPNEPTFPQLWGLRTPASP